MWVARGRRWGSERSSEGLLGAPGVLSAVSGGSFGVIFKAIQLSEVEKSDKLLSIIKNMNEI